MKIKNILTNYSKKQIYISLLIVSLFLSFIIIAYLFFNSSPTLLLKKDTITIEYGDSFTADFNTLVDTKNLNSEEIKLLRNNVKISANFKNETELIQNSDGTTSEKDKGYIKVGNYKITLLYKDIEKTIDVKVIDTTKPELNVPDNIEIIQGSDLSTFNFNTLISATDLSKLKDIQIDYSTIDTNTLGEYNAKASVEDIYKNRVEKNFKVTIIPQLSLNSGEVIVQEEITNPDGTKTIKNIIKKKEESNSTTDKIINNNQTITTKPNENQTNSSQNNDSSGNNSNSSNDNSNNSNSDNNSNNSSNEDSSQKPNPIEIYWIKCKLCGTLIESNISFEDAMNKLKSCICEVDGFIYEGITAHSSYSYGKRQN